ncbi:Ger(x)C family spore germination C-terminal domain-containing protein [Paenibacillus agricola]|uniref:Ger(x)C family spore germination C-terminal domain-containing protein n=1 Tax=Paenibacillus agricola TaxID=2716264 RepID=UPI0035D529C2
MPIKIKAKGALREGGKFLKSKDARNMHKLEHQIENQITGNIEDILKKNLKNQIDTFGFGNYARVYNNLRRI